MQLGERAAVPQLYPWSPSLLSPFLLSQVGAADIGRATVPGCLGAGCSRHQGGGALAKPPGGTQQPALAVGVSGRSPDGSEAKPRQPLPPSLPAVALRALEASQPLPGMNAAQPCAHWGTPSRPERQTGLPSLCAVALKLRPPALAPARAHPLFVYAAK